MSLADCFPSVDVLAAGVSPFAGVVLVLVELVSFEASPVPVESGEAWLGSNCVPPGDPLELEMAMESS